MTEAKTSPIKGISGSTLKIIAIVSMAFDHIGAVLVHSTEPYYILRLIGRIAFPIFCFLLVEGFFHTKNLKKYCFRLALFALISEIPFDLAFYHTAFYPDYQNVFFTLFIGLITISCIHFIKNTLSGRSGLALICELSAILAGMLSAWFLKTDYGELGVLVIVLFYTCYSKRLAGTTGACALLCLSSSLEITAFAAVPLILCYNGRRGISLKYSFYAFYPLHLLLLYFLS